MKQMTFAYAEYAGKRKQARMRIPAKLNSHSGQREHPDP